jgi:hypothetical protein
LRTSSVFPKCGLQRKQRNRRRKWGQRRNEGQNEYYLMDYVLPRAVDVPAFRIETRNARRGTNHSV